MRRIAGDILALVGYLMAFIGLGTLWLFLIMAERF